MKNSMTTFFVGALALTLLTVGCGKNEQNPNNSPNAGAGYVLGIHPSYLFGSYYIQSSLTGAATAASGQENNYYSFLSYLSIEGYGYNRVDAQLASRPLAIQIPQVDQNGQAIQMNSTVLVLFTLVDTSTNTNTSYNNMSNILFALPMRYTMAQSGQGFELAYGQNLRYPNVRITGDTNLATSMAANISFLYQGIGTPILTGYVSRR